MPRRTAGTVHQAEKRLGESKLGEVVRHYRDLKARLDRIEARAVGSYHAYGSLGEVSRKLGSLSSEMRWNELAERRLFALGYSAGRH